ncbi:MTH865 family protein [Halobiforma nitratireducens]|uniref:MTH865-like family protein n=1 Tax=Halobiforma nitratireducens JCM 10879 TaxID=1227454 RepID=M0L9F1_9EURY|nr:MTH865 family protein [Halobiforma nitratireducens]EMA30201.1 hypothetical protein C446_16742 [Halobiforma nitratireducens JCM 10879]
MTEADPEELREQLVDAFGDADYPISSAMALLPTLPDGPATTFESGEFSMTMMEIQEASDVNPLNHFPYESPEELADDIVRGLRSAGELPEDE